MTNAASKSGKRSDNLSQEIHEMMSFFCLFIISATNVARTADNGRSTETAQNTPHTFYS